MLRQLLRLYPAPANRLLVSGVGIERIPLARLRGWIGYVPQEHMLLSRSIGDNIRLGKPDASHEEIARAIEDASLARDIEAMKDGADTSDYALVSN